MVRNTLSTKLTLTKNLQSPYIAIHHLLLCLSLGVRYDCSILCYICMCVYVKYLNLFTSQYLLKVWIYSFVVEVTFVTRLSRNRKNATRYIQTFVVHVQNNNKHIGIRWNASLFTQSKQEKGLCTFSNMLVIGACVLIHM